MRRILHHCDDTAAIVSVSSFFDSRHRFDRQPRFYERFVAVMTQTNRKSELALGQTFGKLPLALTDQKVLLREPTEKFFSFNFPKQTPNILSSPVILGAKQPATALPLGIGKIIQRPTFFAFHL